jgi:molybdopterin molybdotransferase
VISFDEAREVVRRVPPLEIERRRLPSAAGCVLAERLVAPHDLVPFARSAMDGFAVRAADTLHAPVTLPVAASVFAEASVARHAPFTATAITTGGALTEGADAVIPQEETIATPGSIVVAAPASAGRNVFPPGEDARAGEELAAAGRVVDAALLGLLAAAGIACVAVYRRPRVAVVTTGSELVPFEAYPERGQIRDSNAIALAAALRELGAGSVEAETVVDAPQAIADTLRQAFEDHDAVVVTGGASSGERDYVKAVCDELGVNFIFRSVALRPARPTGFGRRGRALVAVLPGNPAAAYVALHEFVRPALAALAGRPGAGMPSVEAQLEGELQAKPGRTFAVFARLQYEDGRFVAAPLPNQCSSLTRLAADADGFILVPPAQGRLRRGQLVSVDVVGWDRVFARPRAPVMP